MQAWILEAVDAWLPAAAAQRLPVWLVIEELWRAQSPPRGPRPCPPFACVLRVLALAVVGLGELPTPQGANAQPELQVGFTQICGLCDDEFTVDVLGSQPFVLVNFFRAGPDLGLNPPNIFPRQRGVVRQRRLNEIVPGPAVDVQGRALSIPGEIGLSAKSSFTGQTFDEFFVDGQRPAMVIDAEDLRSYRMLLAKSEDCRHTAIARHHV
jgi:hypothetical protein